ncbi:histidine phosphatase family protein [Fodinicola feengrottensis]|uniref:Histidine phosphatase family protein n=1 Tax=Fodinicola feengrottensis TaxID=435914 RepID=A0ABN2HU25_9ACTN
MTTVLLVRHGRTIANATAVLAGWTPGVTLDETGQAQAAKLAERLSVVPLSAVVASPLERCQQTAQAVVGDQAGELKIHTDDRLGECRYGDWTGRPIKELAKDPLWKVVQQHPSAVVFPGLEGEALAATQARAVAAIREWDVRVREEHGPDAVWMACSHGDVIKSVLADALGQHLDLFQRIVVDPCSVSVVRYTETRPFVVRMNDTGGDVSALLPPKKRRRKTRAHESDAVVGGGAGAEATPRPAGQ